MSKVQSDSLIGKRSLGQHHLQLLSHEVLPKRDVVLLQATEKCLGIAPGRPLVRNPRINVDEPIRRLQRHCMGRTRHVLLFLHAAVTCISATMQHQKCKQAPCSSRVR